MNAGKLVVIAMVAVIPAYLIGSDLFFRSQVAAQARAGEQTLRVASAGFMRERRSLTLTCLPGKPAQFDLRAKIPEKGFLQVGETAPATLDFGGRDGELQTTGAVTANGFVETVTMPLSAAQAGQLAKQIGTAGDVKITALGRGLTLGLDTTGDEVGNFLARCPAKSADGLIFRSGFRAA